MITKKDTIQLKRIVASVHKLILTKFKIIQPINYNLEKDIGG